MALAVEVASWALLLAGAGFALVGGIGILRLPDLYTRMHAAGVTDTLGAGLILAGLMVQGGATMVTVKLILILIFLWLTSPTASYALGHAALTAGLKPILSRGIGIWQRGYGPPPAEEDAP